jgi:hypothetical protein
MRVMVTAIALAGGQSGRKRWCSRTDHLSEQSEKQRRGQQAGFRSAGMNRSADPTHTMVVGGRRAWAIDLAIGIELRPIAYAVVRATASYERFMWSWPAAGPRGSAGASDSYLPAVCGGGSTPVIQVRLRRFACRRFESISNHRTWSNGGRHGRLASRNGRRRRLAPTHTRARATRSATQCLPVPPMAAHFADGWSRRLVCAPHPLVINECVSRVHLPRGTQRTRDQLDADRAGAIERSSRQTPTAPTSSVGATIDDTATGRACRQRRVARVPTRR